MDVLGRVIEVVSGRSLDDFLQDHVLGPLGMKDTAFSVTQGKVKRLSALYKPEERNGRTGLRRLDGGKTSAWVRGRHCGVLAGGGFMGSCYPTSDASSSVGGLVSTLRDYTRFVRMLQCQGLCPGSGYRLLRKETVAAMFENWLTMDTVSGGARRIKGWHDCGRGSMGWGPLGQVSLGSGPRDVWMGGIAGTFWAIDGARETVVLHVAQVAEAYDFYGEELWKATRLAFAPTFTAGAKKMSENLEEGEQEEGEPPRKRRRKSA